MRNLPGKEMSPKFIVTRHTSNSPLKAAQLPTAAAFAYATRLEFFHA